MAKETQSSSTTKPILFWKVRFAHLQMRMMTEGCNQAVRTFVPTMTGCGMVVCISLNFGIITLADREDIRIIVLAFLIINVVVHGIIMFFCKHASNPAITTQKTLEYWAGQLREKLERRQLKAMRQFGFWIGPFFSAKRSTALDIFASILEYTVNLLCL